MKRLAMALVTAAVALAFCAPLYAQDKAADGKKVFDREKCGTCHNPKLNSLEGVGTKLTGDQIKQWIVNPAEQQKQSKSTSKLKMPAKKLSEADVDALVAYLQTLKK